MVIEMVRSRFIVGKHLLIIIILAALMIVGVSVLFMDSSEAEISPEMQILSSNPRTDIAPMTELVTGTAEGTIDSQAVIVDNHSRILARPPQMPRYEGSMAALQYRSNQSIDMEMSTDMPLRVEEPHFNNRSTPRDAVEQDVDTEPGRQIEEVRHDATRTEIVSKRSADSKTYHHGGNLFTTEISAGPIHYQDESGGWRSIDTTIVDLDRASNRASIGENEGGSRSGFRTGYKYVNDNNGLRSAFAEQFDDPKGVSFGLNDRSWVKWAPMTMEYRTASGIIEIGSANSVASEHENNILRYPNSFPNTTDEFVVQANRVKHNIILGSVESLPDIHSSSSATLCYTGLIEMPEGYSLAVDGIMQNGSFSTSGAIDIVDADGRVKYQMPAPYAYEKSSSRVTIGCKYEIEETPSGIILSVHTPLEWLQNAARSFPVVIDPTIDCYPLYSSWWTGYVTGISTHTKYNNSINVGYDGSLYSCGWSKFDISAIVDTADVTDTTLSIFCNLESADPFLVQYYGLDSDPVTTNADLLYDEIVGNTGTSMYIQVDDFGNTYGWYTKDLGSIADAALESRLTDNWFAVGFDMDSSYTQIAEHIGYSNMSLRPRLSVTYPVGTWTGATNTNWYNSSNWSSSIVPDESIDVTIPTGCSNYPNIASGTAECRNLTIETGGSITVSGGTLYVNNDVSISGVFNQSGGAFYTGYGTGYAGMLDFLNGSSASLTGGNLYTDYFYMNDGCDITGSGTHTLHMYSSEYSNYIYSFDDDSYVNNVSIENSCSLSSTFDLDINGYLDINATLIPSSTLIRCAGNLYMRAGASFQPSSGTVILDGGGTQYITDEESSTNNCYFHNLTLDGSGTKYFSAASNDELDVNGAFTIDSGVSFDFEGTSYPACNLNIGGNLEVYGSIVLNNGSDTIDVDGNVYWYHGSTESIAGGLILFGGMHWYIYNDADFNPAGGTIEFDAATDQYIHNLDSVDDNSSFFFLKLNGSGIRTVYFADDSSTYLAVNYALYIGGSTYHDITFDFEGTAGTDCQLFINGELRVYGSIKMDDADDLIDVDGAVIWYSGSTETIEYGTIRCSSYFLMYDGANFNPMGGTVILDGSSTQYVYDLESGTNNNYFHDLVLSGAGTKYYHSVSNDELGVNGDMVINAGAAFDFQGTSGNACLLHILGSIDIYGTLVMDEAADSVTISGDWTNSGTLSASAGTITFAGGTTQYCTSGGTANPFAGLVVANDGTDLHITGDDVKIDGSLTIASSTTLTVEDGRQVWLDSASYSNSGTLSLGTTGVLIDHDGGWYDYYGGSAGVGTSDLVSAFDNTDDVTIVEGSLTLDDDRSCASLYINTGTLVTMSDGVWVDCEGDLLIDGELVGNAETIEIGGSWVNYGMFTPNNCTLVFDGNGAWQEIWSNGSGIGVGKDLYAVELASGGTAVTVASNTRILDSLTIGAPTTLIIDDYCQLWVDNGSFSNDGALDLYAHSCLIDHNATVYDYYGASTGCNSSALLSTFNSTDAVTVRRGRFGMNRTSACASLTVATGAEFDLIDGYDLTVVGDITIDGALDGNDATIALGGDWSCTSGTYDAQTGTVRFEGGATQTLDGGGADDTRAFFTLEVAASTTLEVVSPLKIDGGLVIDDGASFDLASGVQVWLDSASYPGNGASTIGYAAVSCLIDDDGSRYDYYGGDTGIATNAMVHPFSVDDAVTLKRGTLTMDTTSECAALRIETGTDFVMSGTHGLDCYGNIAINGTLTGDSGIIELDGDWDNRNGHFDRGSTTVRFVGGAASLYSGGFSTEKSLYHVDFDAPTTLVDATLGVYGDCTIGVSSSLSLSGNDLHIAGDWSNFGTFDADGATIHFMDDGSIHSNGTGAGKQLPYVDINSGTRTVADSDLNITEYLFVDSSASLAIEAGKQVLVNGTYIDDGPLTLESGAALVHFDPSEDRWTFYGESGGFGSDALLRSFRSGERVRIASGLFEQQSAHDCEALTVDGGATYEMSVGALDCAGDITIEGVLSAANTIYCGGDWLRTGTFLNNGALVRFYGHEKQNISATHFYDIEFDGMGVKILEGDIWVYNDIVIESVASVTANDYTHRLEGDWHNDGGFDPGEGTVEFGGSTELTGSATHTFSSVSITGSLLAPTTSVIVGRNWTDSGSFDPNSGSVIFTGGKSSTITSTNFHNVCLQKDDGIATAFNGDLTIAGDLQWLGGLLDTNGTTLDIYGDLEVESTGGRIDPTTDWRFLGVDQQLTGNAVPLHGNLYVASMTILSATVDTTIYGTKCEVDGGLTIQPGITFNFGSGAPSVLHVNGSLTAMTGAMIGGENNDARLSIEVVTGTVDCSGATLKYLADGGLHIGPNADITALDSVNFDDCDPSGNALTFEATAPSTIIYPSITFDGSAAYDVWMNAPDVAIFFTDATGGGDNRDYDGEDGGAGDCFWVANGYRYWTGWASEQWQSDSNWAPAVKPTTAERVVVPALENLPASPKIESPGEHCAWLQLRDGGTLNIVAGSLNVEGRLEIASGASFTCEGAAAITVGGDWWHNGSFSAGDGTVIFDGTSELAGSQITEFYDLTVTGMLTLENDIALGHDLSVPDGGSLAAEGATVTFVGATDSTLTAESAISCAEFILDKSDAWRDVVIHGDVTVSYGSLITTGTLNIATGSRFATGGISFQTASGLEMSGGTLAITGDGEVLIVDSGASVMPSAGTVRIEGEVAYDNTDTTYFQDLDIASGGSFAPTSSVATDWLVVAGDLTIETDGTLALNGTSSGGGGGGGGSGGGGPVRGEVVGQSLALGGNFTNDGVFWYGAGANITFASGATQILNAGGLDAGKHLPDLIVYWSGTTVSVPSSSLAVDGAIRVENDTAFEVSAADATLLTSGNISIAGDLTLAPSGSGNLSWQLATDVEVTVEASGTLALDGVDNTTMVHIESAVPGTPWYLTDHTADHSIPIVHHARVADSDASRGHAIHAYDGTNIDAGNNTNWVIDRIVDHFMIRGGPANTGTVYSDNATAMVNLTADDALELYAAGFNRTLLFDLGPYTAAYIADIAVTWSTTDTLDDLAGYLGPHLNFTPVAAPANGTILVEDAFGHHNETVRINVSVGALAAVGVTDTEGRIGTLFDATYELTVLEELTLWGAGYDSDGNFIANYAGNWTTAGGLDTASTTNTTNFTFDPETPETSGTITYTLDANATVRYQWSTATISVTWPAPTSIEIVYLTNTTPYPSRSVAVGTEISARAFAFNSTVGPMYTVAVDWSVLNTGGSGATTAPSSGITSVFDAGLDAGTAYWVADHATLGLSDSVMFEILAATVDAVRITADAGSAELSAQSLPVGATLDSYASGYNDTAGYVGLVGASWRVANDGTNGWVEPTSGESATVQVGTGAGTITVTASVDALGIDDSVTITVLAPTYDLLEITDAPDGTPLSAQTLPVGTELSGYASGYNRTSGYIDTLSVIWSLEANETTADLSDSYGESCLLSTGDTGGIATWSITSDTLGLEDHLTVNVLPPSHDGLEITQMPGGAVVADADVIVGFNSTLYASAYNDTIGYFGLVAVDWRVENNGSGSFIDADNGTHTTFDAGLVGGTATLRAANATLGVASYVNYTVLRPTLDRIVITRTPGGVAVAAGWRAVGETITGYASGYNTTAGSIGLVAVNWSLTTTGNATAYLIGDNASSAVGTLFTGNGSGSASWSVEHPNGVNAIVQFLIRAPAPDDITICASSTGAPLTNRHIAVGFETTGYLRLRNASIGYFANPTLLAGTQWSVANEDGGTASTAPAQGASSVFDAGLSGGTAVWSATLAIPETRAVLVGEVQFDIDAPTVDELRITATPNGPTLTGRTVPVHFSIEGVASAYNDTAGYIGTRSVSWAVENREGASASSAPLSGTSSQFNAGETAGEAIWTVDDGAGHSASVTFTIAAPTADWLEIRDAPGGVGMATRTLPVGASLEGYAVVFNTSIGALGLRNAQWSVVNESGASAWVTHATGTNATFHAGHTGGEVLWQVRTVLTGLETTVFITILPPTADMLQITAAPGAEPLADLELAVGASLSGYASAYNVSIDYFGLEDGANWSVDESGGADGTISSATGNASTLQIGTAGGTLVWSIEDAGGHTASVTITVAPPTADAVAITAAAGGADLVPAPLAVGTSVEAFASLMNTTAGFIGVAEGAQWSVTNDGGANASVSPATGAQSTLSAGLDLRGGSAVLAVSAGGGLDASVTVLILPAALDALAIATDAAGTQWLMDEPISVTVGDTLELYAFGTNRTLGLASPMPTTVGWSVTPALAAVEPAHGNRTTLTAAQAGTARIIVNDTKGHWNESAPLTIIPPPDTTAPSILDGRVPLPDSTNVSTVVEVQVPFGEPLSQSSLSVTVEAQTEGESSGWSEVSGQTSYDTENDVLLFTPDEELASQTQHRVSIVVEDIAGNPLSASWVFVTGAPHDTDGDGMPDYWEREMGLDPDVDDGGDDSDGDGLTNREEFERKTNPKTVDTDGDGMPDGWEVENGLEPTYPGDAEADWDNDGHTNLDEYEGGSDPQNEASVPTIAAEPDDGGGYWWLIIVIIIVVVILILLVALRRRAEDPATVYAEEDEEEDALAGTAAPTPPERKGESGLATAAKTGGRAPSAAGAKMSMVSAKATTEPTKASQKAATPDAGSSSAGKKRIVGCPECGAPLRNDARSCEGCGASFGTGELAALKPLDKKKQVPTPKPPKEPAPPAPSRPKREVTLYPAESAVKCNVCFGVIKPGLTVLKCSCGKKYHEACAGRIGSCPACGQSFKDYVDTSRGTEPSAASGYDIEAMMEARAEREPDANQKEPTVEVVDSAVKCKVCFGVVKPGLKIVRCGCGQKYHVACARRGGACPNCGYDFTMLDLDAMEQAVPEAGDDRGGSGGSAGDATKGAAEDGELLDELDLKSIEDAFDF